VSHGEDGGVINDVDHDLLRGREAARGARVEVASGRCPIHRSSAQKDREEVQGCAPDKGKENRRKGRGLGSPEVANFTGDACRRAEAQRGILWWLVDVLGEKQRRERAGSRGYLRTRSTGGGARVSEQKARLDGGVDPVQGEES
jgi:hypothetical protein